VHHDVVAYAGLGDKIESDLSNCAAKLHTGDTRKA
jgi:hypothetical protein